MCKLCLSARQVVWKVQGVDDVGTGVLNVVIPVHLHTVSFSLQAGPKWTGGKSAQAAIPNAFAHTVLEILPCVLKSHPLGRTQLANRAQRRASAGAQWQRTRSGSPGTRAMLMGAVSVSLAVVVGRPGGPASERHWVRQVAKLNILPVASRAGHPHQRQQSWTPAWQECPLAKPRGGDAQQHRGFRATHPRAAHLTFGWPRCTPCPRRRHCRRARQTDSVLQPVRSQRRAVSQAVDEAHGVAKQAIKQPAGSADVRNSWRGLPGPGQGGETLAVLMLSFLLAPEVVTALAMRLHSGTSVSSPPSTPLEYTVTA